MTEAWCHLPSDTLACIWRHHRNLVGLQGATYFSPMRLFSVATGTVILSFDPQQNAVIMYFNAATMSYLPDKYGATTPANPTKSICT